MSRRALGNRSGFTLLETLIAVTLMVVAFAAVLTVESGALATAGRTRKLNVVAMLARRAMIEAENKFQGKAFSEVGEEESDAFDPPFAAYKWTRKVKELEFPNLSVVQGQGSGEGNGDRDEEGQGQSQFIEMVTKLLTKHLNKSVREVSVTVSWKARPDSEAEDQSFTVSTYWVDLNHEFSFTQ